MGAAALAVPADLGAGVSVAAVVAAPMDAGAAAVGACRSDPAARGRRRAESDADAGRPPALLFRDRDGVPWRAGTHAAAGKIPHRILRSAVVRRNDRGVVRRADRAVHLLLDRGISDPDRAGRAVPAARARAAAAMEPLELGLARGACSGADRG